MRRRAQRGVALLVALLVVALAAILIAGLLSRGELAFARARNVVRSAQAEAYAQGLQQYAAKVLLDSWDQTRDFNASAWAVPLPPQRVEGGTISATLRDLDGLFNLNNLAPEVPRRDEWLRLFRALLVERELDPRVADAVAAWLDPDSSEDNAWYLALPQPYRPYRGRFSHRSELRLVRGVDARAYARLAPLVCALSPGTRLNVNTAPPPLLVALGLSRGEAERLWRGGSARYDSVAAFLEEAGDPGLQTLQDLLSVRSSWFLARARVELEDLSFDFISVLQRSEGGGVRVVMRSRGGEETQEEASLLPNLAPPPR